MQTSQATEMDELYKKLTQMVFHMEFMKLALVTFINLYEKTTSVRFCLSYDPIKWDLIAFRMNIMSIRKCI